jgi:hypothetical protein
MDYNAKSYHNLWNLWEELRSDIFIYEAALSRPPRNATMSQIDEIRTALKDSQDAITRIELALSAAA